MNARTLEAEYRPSAVVFLAGVVLAGQSYVGLYRTVSLDVMGKDREAAKRPGEVRFLRLAKDKRWVWRDMMVGFGGTWQVKGQTVYLRVTSTPRGPTRKPSTLMLRAERGGKRLVALDPKLRGRLSFVPDPGLLTRLQREMRARIDAARRSAAKPRG